ncbi:unnamed protein product, partial [Polarella glacialis]
DQLPTRTACQDVFAMAAVSVAAHADDNGITFAQVKNTFIDFRDGENLLYEKWSMRRVASCPAELFCQTSSDCVARAGLQTWKHHQQGQCRPCSYFHFRPDGCRKAHGCTHCHFCTPEQARARMHQTRTSAKAAKEAARLLLQTNPAYETMPSLSVLGVDDAAQLDLIRNTTFP